ncbi:uncharacterized protein LOC129109937 [Anoplopoma fimbria]|uniref:uncharacterized protein LOC129109937 n=1 Tax=Anoplopoma fimbria TaxID=229290 RepID=UPI0023EB791C|nr:uncharacterized protein LOC129109937 [Anoplopoma fimbria]
MAQTTIKGALRRALGDLTKDDFLLFGHELRDRREEPRVLRSDVEGKGVLEITDLLVSKFTEPKARQVAVEILRQINCNEEAEKLNLRVVVDSLPDNINKLTDSKTKACIDKGDPVFRKTPTGELEMKPSQEALNHVASHGPLQAAGHGGPPKSVKEPEEVEAEAKACVLSEGGDARNERLVLSRCTIQFGQYKGQSFKWLLENDVGYIAYLFAHQQYKRCPRSLKVNKDCLTRYACAYPEVLEEVRFPCGYNRSLQSGQEGNALIGFGRYKSDKLQDLYESKDKEKISYVNYLRTKKSTCIPGSKMDVAVGYILQCDQNPSAAANNRPTTSFPPRAVRKTQTRKKRVQSTRRQPSSASRTKRRKL